MTMDFPKEKIDRIKARYGDAIEEVVSERTDVPIFYVRKEKILEVLSSIRTEEGLEYNFLADLTAYDDNPPLDKVTDYGLGTLKNPGGDHRFVVVYQMFSLQNHDRIRIKVRVREEEETPSVVGIWKAANWLEREVFDLYGVKFSGHPNLRRIMLDERWVGYPQRKDYPIKRYQRFEGASTTDSFGLDPSAERMTRHAMRQEKIAVPSPKSPADVMESE
jgi:NADH-quinone oxidoreductase subunit C